MTTDQIQNEANRGQLATADFDIGQVLRSSVIPTFLADVGRMGWRRKVASFQTVVGQQAYQLPLDFFELEEIKRDNSCQPYSYIGEDAGRIFKAEGATTRGDSYEYYIVADTDPTRKAIKLALPAVSVCTIRIAYFFCIPFADATTSVDLAASIPTDYHWALVDLLRREIYEDRYGQGDQRWQTADAKYKAWVQRVRLKRHLAAKGHRADYVR